MARDRNSSDLTDSTKTLGLSRQGESGNGEREFHPGEAIGRYIVLSPVGRGGMGVVLAAYDPELDRKVAIKLLHAGAPGSGGTPARTRLQREARAMAKLSHPNVVAVHDVGLFEGEVFLAMEFVRGGTLGAWRRERPDASWREVVEIFLAAGTGLAAAHNKGLVHRDFKPENVLISNEGTVKVTDFGLARAATCVEPQAEATAAPQPETLRDNGDLLSSPVTVAGMVMGTPAYLPPEAYAEPPRLDARSDQFAFCVALWESLFGRRPFSGPTYVAMLTAMSRGQIEEPPAGHDVPPLVIDILRRGLSADPELRWPSMHELMAELRDRLAPAQARGRLRRAIAWSSLPLAVLIAGALWWNHRAQLCTDADLPLAGVWNTDRRTVLASAAETLEGPDAATVGARLLGFIDAWSQRWSSTRIDACRATRLRGEQSEQLLDLRMACLDRKLMEMDAFLTLLSSGGGLPEGAPEAAFRAAPLALCSDAVALAAPIAPPEGQETARQVEALRRGLAEAEALLLTGKPAPSLAAALRTETAAQDLDYAPLAAEAADLATRGLLQVGDYDGALQSAHRELSAALEGRHEYFLVAAMIQLMGIEGSAVNDFPEARRWYEHASKALGRVGTSRSQLEARLDNGWGEVLYGEGDLEHSLETFQRAYQLYVAAEGAESPNSLGAANNIVVLLYSLGRVQEAYDRLVPLAATMESALGRLHPHMTYVLNNLAEAASSLGRPNECLEHGEEALERSIEIFGSNQPTQVNTLVNLGACLSTVGRHEEALERHRQALDIVTATLGDSHPQVVLARIGMARALTGLGRHSEAIEMARRATALGEQLSAGTESGATETWVESLSELSRALRAAGRGGEAVEASSRAVELLRVAGRVDQTAAGRTFSELGHAQLAAGSPSAAVASFEQALKLTEAGEPEGKVEDPEGLAEARLGLAMSLAGLSRDQGRALDLAERARGFYEAREGESSRLAVKQIDNLLASLAPTRVD